MNKTPTGISLMKRSHVGSSWCVIHQQDEESNDHLFLFCRTLQHILGAIPLLFGHTSTLGRVKHKGGMEQLVESFPEHEESQSPLII